MKHIDAIIILGRGINADGTLPADPKARIETGANVLAEHPEARLVMSGKWSFHLTTPPARPEAEAMAEYAQTLGVSPEKILQEKTSTDTISNAYYVKTLILIPRNWKNVIVVSSPDHIERVKYIFNYVLGPDYAIEYVTSPLTISPEEVAPMQKKEDRSLWGAQRLLAGQNIQPGDQEAVMHQVLEQYIPGIGTDREAIMSNIQALQAEYDAFLQAKA